MTRHITIIACCAIFLVSCGNSTENEEKNTQLEELTSLLELDEFEPRGEYIEEITFETITRDPIDIEIFQDSIIPWISLENPSPFIDSLVGKDEVVVHSANVILVIDYPVEKPIEIELKSDSDQGFTRAELITKISSEYHRIYQEEEETSTVEVTPMEDREIMNRNTTDGKYGIWGHDLADLDLSTVVIYKDGDDILLYLYVES